MAINPLTQQSYNPYNQNSLSAVYQPWGSNIGVGTNTPAIPVGSTLNTQAIRQTLGNAADWIGGKLGIPETGLSEKIAGGPTKNTGAVYAANTGQDLVAALISKGGYNYTDAVNAANGPNASNLRNEFLGGGGANTGPGGDYPQAPPRNPLLDKDYSTTNLGGSLTDTGGQNPSSGIFDEIFEAAKAGNQSAIDMINSQYGQNESELNRQLGMTDTYEGNDLATLLARFNKTGTEVEGQKTTAKETVDQETAKAADQARSTQRQNRNVLRALGILGSTYAAENLAAPMNQFDKQKAELVNWGTKRMGELENYANEKRDEFDRLTNEVKTKYGELREKIMADLRYNGQQKADALKAATAGAQQNLAQLNMQKAQYEQQIQQYSQSLTTQIAQMLMNKAPNANLDQIAKQSIAFSNNLMGTSPNKQVAVVPGQSKAGGFDMSNYIGWDPNSAYQDYLSKNKSLT